MSGRLPGSSPASSRIASVKPGFEPQPGALRRAFDGAPQLGPPHRADQDLVVADAIREPGIPRAGRVEVGPQARSRRGPGDRARRGERREHLEERVADRAGSGRCVKQLFELVDPDSPGFHGHETERDPGSAARSSALRRSARRSGSSRCELVGQLVERIRDPGVKSNGGPVLAARERAAATPGTSPARSNEDLPLPEGPPITRVARRLQAARRVRRRAPRGRRRTPRPAVGTPPGPCTGTSRRRAAARKPTPRDLESLGQRLQGRSLPLGHAWRSARSGSGARPARQERVATPAGAVAELRIQ